MNLAFYYVFVLLQTMKNNTCLCPTEHVGKDDHVDQ